MNTPSHLVQQQLNRAQQEAVETTHGALLVVAGAGSGKTRVITHRIAYLIHQNIAKGNEILALTFTNKAAQEMKERIRNLLSGIDHTFPFVGTFHGYCVHLLKQHRILTGQPPFSILDEEDQLIFMRTVIKNNNLSRLITAKQLLYHISTLAHVSSDIIKIPLFVQEAAAQYTRMKKDSNALDFDDLMYETVRLLQTNHPFGQKIRSRLRHILVDEYQDTNTIQRTLLLELTHDNNTLTVDSICAVGDEDQSIYSWRGATIENMLSFKTDFPACQYIKIEQNYRSHMEILHVANELIAHNKQRTPKKLWSDNIGKHRVALARCLSDMQESEFVVHAIEQYKKLYPQASIGILYRTHAQSRTIEEFLIRYAVPYIIIGNTHFYARKEIKDLLAYLRLVINPFDRASFIRIINTPSRGLGEKCEEIIFDIWNQQPFLTYREILQHVTSHELISRAQIRGVEKFLAIFEKLTPEMKPLLALSAIIENTEYITYLKETYELDEARSRIENVNELLRAVDGSSENSTSSTIEIFLDAIALMQDTLARTHHNVIPVSIMTLHAAKGLEFDFVSIIGLEHGILPSARTFNSTQEVEEERRLLYVGITRAREYLLLSHSEYRYLYGSMTDQVPSSFLAEIPQNAYCSINMKKINLNMYNSLLNHWFSGNILGEKRESISTSSSKKNLGQKASSSKLHVVEHATYGIGTVQDTEIRTDGKQYATVKFRTGVKKILTSFLRSI